MWHFTSIFMVRIGAKAPIKVLREIIADFGFFCRTLCWKKCEITDFAKILRILRREPPMDSAKSQILRIFGKAKKLQVFLSF
jgi:uncharacterized protein YifN (PemK superfamily)